MRIFGTLTCQSHQCESVKDAYAKHPPYYSVAPGELMKSCL